MFFANWLLYDWHGGTLPGYQVLLCLGNLGLIYFWHPIFSEEINFWPKFVMLILGQFGLALIINLAIYLLHERLTKRIKSDR